MIQVEWTHPRRQMVEVLCERHEAQVIGALNVLALAHQSTITPEGVACIRCVIEEAGLEPRLFYGLVG